MGCETLANEQRVILLSCQLTILPARGSELDGSLGSLSPNLLKAVNRFWLTASEILILQVSDT